MFWYKILVGLSICLTINANYTTSSISTNTTLNSSTSDANQNSTTPFFVSGNNANTTLTNGRGSTNVTLLDLNATTVPPPDVCLGKRKWQQDKYFADCLDKASAERKFAKLTQYAACSAWDGGIERQQIISNVPACAIQAANEITLKEGQDANMKITKVRAFANTSRFFDVEYGYIQKNFLKVTSDLYLPVQLNHPLQIYIAAKELSEKLEAYQMTVYRNIFPPGTVMRFYQENTGYRKSLLTLLGEDWKKIEKGPGEPFILNSDVIAFEVMPKKDVIKDFLKIKFKMKNWKKTKDHHCVRLKGSLFSNQWTDAGCHTHKPQQDVIKCWCDQWGTYAVLSKIDVTIVVNDELQRTDVTQMMVGVCIFCLLLVVPCLIFPYACKCSHLPVVKIFISTDITLVVEYVFLIIGVLQSAEGGASRLIGSALHFLHHSIMMWNLMEGIHLYHGVRPMYDPGLMPAQFFYSTIALGLPAAFAAASFGYEGDTPDRSEFAWMISDGGGMGYSIVPTLIIVIILAVLDVLLAFELRAWMGTTHEYIYRRSLRFIKTSLGFTFAYILTAISGILARQNPAKQSYAYFLMIFLVIQAILALTFHVFKNFEVWEWRAENMAPVTFEEKPESNSDLKSPAFLVDTFKNNVAGTDGRAESELSIIRSDSSLSSDHRY